MVKVFDEDRIRYVSCATLSPRLYGRFIEFYRAHQQAADAEQIVAIWNSKMRRPEDCVLLRAKPLKEVNWFPETPS